MFLARTHQEANRVRTAPLAILSVVDVVATAIVPSGPTTSNQVQHLNVARPVQTAAMNAVLNATAAQTKTHAARPPLVSSLVTTSNPVPRLNVPCAPRLRQQPALMLPADQTHCKRHRTEASPAPNAHVTAMAVIAPPVVTVPSKVSTRNAPPVTTSLRKKKLRQKSPVVLTLQPTRNPRQWHPLQHRWPSR